MAGTSTNVKLFVARSGAKTGEPDCQAAFETVDDAIGFLADLHGLEIEDCRRLKRQMSLPLRRKVHGADQCSVQQESMPAAKAAMALTGELYLRDAARVLTPRKINKALKQEVKIRPKKRAKKTAPPRRSNAEKRTSVAKPPVKKSAPKPKARATRVSKASKKVATKTTNGARKQKAATKKLARSIKATKVSKAGARKPAPLRKKTGVKNAKTPAKKVAAAPKKTQKIKATKSSTPTNPTKALDPGKPRATKAAKKDKGPGVLGFARPRSFSNDRIQSLQPSLFRESEGLD